MIVGNPNAIPIMQYARAAYRKHGVSVQGMLPDFLGAPDSYFVRAVFWRYALVEAGVTPRLAYSVAEDLEKAATFIGRAIARARYPELRS